MSIILNHRIKYTRQMPSLIHVFCELCLFVPQTFELFSKTKQHINNQNLIINFRMGVKLNELVQRGSTTVKHKGKTFRVKTPVCRALKNLHNKGGDKSGLQKGKKCMPTKVTIDLKPLDTKDWCRTHKLAQNPHIKVSLGLQRKVSSLINCLSNKWKSRETKAFELLQAKDENPRAEELQEELVLFPSQSAKPNFTLITVAHVLTSSQISLQSMKPDKPQQVQNVPLSLTGLYTIFCRLCIQMMMRTETTEIVYYLRKMYCQFLPYIVCMSIRKYFWENVKLKLIFQIKERGVCCSI